MYMFLRIGWWKGKFLDEWVYGEENNEEGKVLISNVIFARIILLTLAAACGEHAREA